MLIAIAAAPWPYGSATDVARYTVAAVVLAALAVWLLGAALAGERLPWIALPAFALPALALLQAATGVSVARIFTVEAALLLAAMNGVIAFWSVRARNGDAARRLVFVVLGTCVAQAAFGAVQWSISPSRIYGQATPYVTMPFGSYVNHNHFAGLVGMGAVLAAGMAIAYARHRNTIPPAALAAGGVALALAATHLASRSRGGLLALVGGLVSLGILWLMAISFRGGRRRPTVLAGGAALALIIAFGWFAIPGDTRAHLATAFSGRTDGSGVYRIDIAAATLRAFADRPLTGFGFGAYEDAIPAYKRAHGDVRVRHAESDALEVLTEGGLVGLACIGWLIVAVVSGLRDRVTVSRDAFRNGLALAAAGGAATLLVHSLIDFNLRLPANALVFAALAGVAASPRTEPRALGGRGLSLAVGAVFIALAMTSTWRAYGAGASDRAFATTDPVRRLAAFDRAVSAHPYVADLFRARAQLWRDLAHRGAGWDPARLGRADADVRRALGLRPRWAEAWADYGWVRHFQGDASGSRLAMQSAVDFDPTHADVALAAADLLARQGDGRGAMERLRRIRGVNPGWPDARIQLETARLLSESVKAGTSSRN